MEEEITRHLEILGNILKELYHLLEIKKKEEEIVSLQFKMASASFWSNQKEANASVERLKNIKDDVDSWHSLKKRVDDLKELMALSQEEDKSVLEKECNNLAQEIDRFKLRVLMREKFDNCSAILEINSGAGGTEACDWVQMLFRMYMRWAESKKFEAKVINEVRGEEVGFKNITFLIEGKYAYGYLKSERGVHRLVRISPFDANKRRHTSFASVAVYPHIKDEISLDIRPEELKIETFRAAGHGGQHVNVTDSAVRITHLPTGIVVSCQNERSQYQNKQSALSVLKAKLYEFNQKKRQKELEKISGQKMRIEWGSQIRSYVLCPYLLVKDHRTNIENHNAWAVLDGEIDEFIIGFLKSNLK